MAEVDAVRLAEVALFTIEPTDRALEGWLPPQRRTFAILPEPELAEYLTFQFPPYFPCWSA